MGTALESLGLSTEPIEQGGDDVCYNIKHYEEGAQDDDGDELEPEQQCYEVDGQSYHCTRAHV